MSIASNPWIIAIRPKTLPASISPILVANLLCLGPDFRLLTAALTMLCALLLQISVNFANDYFDYRSGVDTDQRQGPVRAIQSGHVTPAMMLWSAIITVVLAVLIGLYLIWTGGWPILTIAITSVICVFWYSGGPFPLASLGLGEVTVFIFFGIAAVLGTQYLHLQTVTATGIWVAIQMGLLSAAIMLVNNIRDIPTDQQAGKRTLAVRLGLENSRRLYQILVITPLLIQTWLFVHTAKDVGPALPFLSIPWLMKLIKKLPERSGQALNQQLAETAKYLLLFAVLVGTGLIISHL
ncbi:1,4-dihydroxy-2-naphthoate polyprenyltransferase [Gynuella sunshinyii]|uniref:1,4-dihydroxy-2-naphthoate octaprenyltransferase n=1 Tax=Gynuella sunshinyii YC6258 TaxID=1445510 RepID=A0A0C5VTK1_9GAMM|nr:1,4-dihydroxy-2-naphthoate polyprenyltransferase [Gynuella sunshinyii]AJQ93644.1 1,4-dihydroxy-2-naphthoate octaprenyltransferase [Gynuella sunshinyii YC6258]